MWNFHKVMSYLFSWNWAITYNTSSLKTTRLDGTNAAREL